MNRHNLWSHDQNLRPLRRFIESIPYLQKEGYPQPFLDFLESFKFLDMMSEAFSQQTTTSHVRRPQGQALTHYVREFETQLLLRLCPDILEEISAQDLVRPLVITGHPEFGLSFHSSSQGKKHYSQDYYDFLANYLFSRDLYQGLNKGDLIKHVWLNNSQNEGTLICAKDGVENLEEGKIPSSYLTPSQFPFNYWSGTQGLSGPSKSFVPLDLKALRKQIPSQPGPINKYYYLPLKYEGQTFFLSYPDSFQETLLTQDSIRVQHIVNPNGNEVLVLK